MIGPRYLGPDDLDRCSKALNNALSDIGAVSDTIRTEMAKRILQAVKAGEKDIAKLKLSATAWIKAA